MHCGGTVAGVLSRWVAMGLQRSENLPPLQDSDESWDLRPDIKIRGELLRVAEKCVPTWLSLPWGNDPFMAGAGLSSDQVRTSRAAPPNSLALTYRAPAGARKRARASGRAPRVSDVTQLTRLRFPGCLQGGCPARCVGWLGVRWSYSGDNGGPSPGGVQAWPLPAPSPHASNISRVEYFAGLGGSGAGRAAQAALAPGQPLHPKL